MKTIVPLILISLIAVSGQSHASSLFYDNCVGKQADAADYGAIPEVQFAGLVGIDEGDSYILVRNQSGFLGMSCQDLKSTFEGATALGIGLWPASKVLKMTGATGEIAAGLADLGLAVSSTAVVSVTFLGATGVVIVYFIAKQSLKDCEAREKQQYKQELMRDIQNSFHLKSQGDVPFEVHADDGAA